LLISIGLILRNADIDNAKKVLRMAKVIDDKADWAGGSDILVQTGDIVDRGTYALDIYRLMQKLRGQADAAGGRVVSILGNHEIMNAIGDWRWASAVGEVADCVRYVTSADIKRFGSSTKRQQDLSSEGWLGQEWLAK
jgi:3',5'-cyclic AMP phosphodiesterase CpdA